MDNLHELAVRASRRPFFLGWALSAAGKLSDAELAARLECSPAALDRLRLCRRPRPDEATFAADVARIAAAFQISGAALERLTTA